MTGLNHTTPPLAHNFVEPEGEDAPTFRLDLWRATEALREEDGIVFIPFAGSYMRADPEQKYRRSRRFMRAAGRKMVRVKEILDSVAPADVAAENRHLFDLARDKVGQLVAAQDQVRHLRRIDPPNSPDAIGGKRGQ